MKMIIPGSKVKFLMSYVSRVYAIAVVILLCAGEVKTLLIQLLRAVHHLHDNWILHRDLKASNLLLSHKGILKVGVTLL